MLDSGSVVAKKTLLGACLLSSFRSHGASVGAEVFGFPDALKITLKVGGINAQLVGG